VEVVLLFFWHKNQEEDEELFYGELTCFPMCSNYTFGDINSSYYSGTNFEGNIQPKGIEIEDFTYAFVQGVCFWKVQSTRICARGVLLESTPKLIFQAVIRDQHVYLI
jgi:hypothetical protein